jgi:hypothetical protein
MVRLLPVLGAAFLWTAAAQPANATILDYELTGAVTASWQLDNSQPPSDVRASMFGYWNVPITVNGVYYASSVIYFFPDSEFGGVEADLGLNSDGSGAGTFFSAASQEAVSGQLYSGTLADPVLLTGTWDFFEAGDWDGSSNYPPDVYQLVVSEVTAVPEPASWAMLMAGAGMLGGLARGRKRKAEGDVPSPPDPRPLLGACRRLGVAARS